MRNFRNDGSRATAPRAEAAARRLTVRGLAAGLVLLAAVGPAGAAGDPGQPPAPPTLGQPTLGPPLRLGVPQRITPLPQEPPAVVGPVKPADASSTGGATASDGTPILVDPLAPIDPDWAGPLTPEQGGFAQTLWQGTPRSLVVALVPRLGATSSPVLQGLTRRLLLSNAVAPGPRPADGMAGGAGGDEPADLVDLRLERLIDAGQVESANTVLGLVPARGDGEGLSRRRVDLAFLANDTKAACARVSEGVRRYKTPWWSRALIACQALSGDSAGAGLGIDLLREQKAPKDDAFETLVQAAGGRKVKLEHLANPSPIHLALLAAAKLPLPADALSSASPAVLLAWAGAEGAPLPQRLVAAERAAAFGALSLDRLRALYESVEITPEERANAISRAAAEKGSRGHALLYVAAKAQPIGSARAEVLQAMLAQSRKDGDFVLIGRVVAPLVLEMKPSMDLGWFAGDATRALLLTGHPAEARFWFAVADPETAQDLYPLARLAVGRDIAWDGKQLTAAVAAALKADSEGGARQAAIVLALLSAFDDPIGPADWGPLFARLPLASLDLPGAPIWFDLPRAAAAHRIGETVLLALLTAADGGKLTAQPTRLTRATEGLRAAGLEADARALAVEAALTAGF